MNKKCLNLLQIRIQLSFWQLDLFSWFKSRHSKVWTTGTAKSITKITLKIQILFKFPNCLNSIKKFETYTSTRRCCWLNSWFFCLTSFQLFSQSTRTIFTSLTLPSCATNYAINKIFIKNYDLFVWNQQYLLMFQLLV